MDYNGFWLFITVSLIFIDDILTDPGSKSNEIICITSCADKHEGWYASCRACNKYFKCNHNGGQERNCPQGEEWNDNDDVKTCQRGMSPTCSLQDEIYPNPSSTTTVASSSSSTSSSSSSSTSSLTPTTEVTAVLMRCNSSSILFPDWFPCEYVLIIAAITGILPSLICLLCRVCRRRGKGAKVLKMKPSTLRRHMVTVSTQTVVTSTHEYGDSGIYTDLNRPELQENGHVINPYAVSQSAETYQSMQVPQVPHVPNEYADINNPANTGNTYLELCGYSYLQSQDPEARRDIDRTLAPIIKKLCEKYNKKSTEYSDMEGDLAKFTNKEYV